MEKNEKELRVIANNIRNKLSQTYEIIDSIKLYEGMSDTAFRESLGLIKKAIATANNDFLLSDSYWEKSIKEQK